MTLFNLHDVMCYYLQFTVYHMQHNSSQTPEELQQENNEILFIVKVCYLY